jgi:hypothetical protein
MIEVFQPWKARLHHTLIFSMEDAVHEAASPHIIAAVIVQ